MRLAPIKSRVPLGSSICVTLYAGEPQQGTLLDIVDECLIISDPYGSEIILEANAIAMVRLSSGVDDTAMTGSGTGVRELGPLRPIPKLAAAAIAPTSQPPVQQATPQTVAVQPAPLLTEAVRSVPLPTEAVEALAKLERYVRATSLDIPAIEWNIYDGHLDAELREQFSRDLLAIRNRYEYAVKMKEGERIQQCVSGLRKITDNYQAPDVLQIAGRMLWQLGRRKQARDLFAEAVDALNDSLSCFDLAMAQRMTDEREYAPGTLRNCLHEDSPPRALALMALTAIVLTENDGLTELARLVQDAAQWRPGPIRLAVLHCGLICVPKPDLIGFPSDRWDSPDVASEAFIVLARTLDSRPVPAVVVSTSDAPRSRVTQAAVVPLTPATADAPSPATVKDLAVEVHACLNRKDVLAAERAFRRLKSLAPLDALTWDAERALSNARSTAMQAAPISSPPPQLTSHKPTVKPAVKPTVKPAVKPTVKPAVKPTAKPAVKPSGASSPFARAEEAFRRDDLEQAEQLLKLAIAHGDQLTRAVQRLVYILSTRLKRREDALAILEENKRFFRTSVEQWSWSQARSTVLEHAGRWQEAIEQLRPMIGFAPTREDRIRVVKRMTAALLKDMQHAEAKELLENELRRHPRQRSLESLLEQINTAMETGIWSAVEMTLQLQAETTTDLSPLLTFHLERCEYWGVPARAGRAASSTRRTSSGSTTWSPVAPASACSVRTCPGNAPRPTSRPPASCKTSG